MKKNKKIIVIVAVIIVLLIAVITSPTESADKPTTKGDITVSETTTEESTTTVPQREEAIGKSDKDISDLLEDSIAMSMHNDATGKWKYALYASTESFESYALSYYEKYFKTEDSNEVHWIINFTNKTTTSIKCMSGILFVDVFEYVENEEHDAKVIGGGQMLSQYLIYLDNGDIEKI